MKKLLTTIIVIIALAVMFVYACIGAVLQESYKLNPPTEAEIMGE